MKKIKKFIKRMLEYTRPVIKQTIVFGDIALTQPVSRLFGLDRGMPIDRYYINKFLGENVKQIQGKVLEIANSAYSKQFGTNVSSYEVLYYDNSNKNATIIGDLTKPDELPEGKVDCFICTQTLNFIFDVQKAIQSCYKLLKKGGCLLCTVSGICQISRYDMDRWGDYWRFTDLSIRKLFEAIFPKDKIEIQSYGNTLAATVFLQGLALEDLPDKTVLDVHDIDYQVTIAIKAIK
jgi:SAM-dependent methyltransferase